MTNLTPSQIRTAIRSVKQKQDKHFLLPINEELLETARNTADRHYMTLSAFIRQSIKRNIKRYNSNDE